MAPKALRTILSLFLGLCIARSALAGPKNEGGIQNHGPGNISGKESEAETPSARSPELGNASEPPTGDPPPPPPGPQCLASEKLVGTQCKQCVYLVKSAGEGPMWDLECKRNKPTRWYWDCHVEDIYQVRPGYHGIAAGFRKQDVVVGMGIDDDVPALDWIDDKLTEILARNPIWDAGKGSETMYAVFYEIIKFLYPPESSAGPNWSKNTAYALRFGENGIEYSDIRYIVGDRGNGTEEIAVNGVSMGFAPWVLFAALDYNGRALRTEDVFVENQTATLSPNLKANYVTCGERLVRGWSSPVSLVMPGCSFETVKPSIVEFPIDHTKKEEKFTTWYGSACTPLLVEDQGQGKNVSSATQLLGNWTRGGRPGEDGKTRQPFANGFEALSTFDADKNGALEGSELASLMIWTDKNANAVSDAGEVASLSESGITKLTFDKEQSFVAGTLRVVNGYTMNSAKGPVTGDLVDWYGSTSKTAADLQAVTATNREARKALQPSDAKKNLDALCSLQNGVAGVWRWRMRGSEGAAKTMGYFLLQDAGNEKITGYSFVLGHDEERKAIRVNGFKLDGNALPGLGSTLAKSQPEWAFEISDGAGKNLSKMALDPKKQVLTGETTASYEGNKPVYYEWEAKKVGC